MPFTRCKDVVSRCNFRQPKSTQVSSVGGFETQVRGQSGNCFYHFGTFKATSVIIKLTKFHDILAKFVKKT